MKTRLALFATLSFIVAQLISGCAGIAAALDVTQFAAGTYSGSYRSQGGEQSGTATITVSKEGQILGTGHNDTLNADFTIDAHLANSGTIRGTIVTNGNSDPLNGKLTYKESALSGGLTQTMDDGSKLVLDFDLRKQ